jgi:hypothetical protein
VVKEILTTEETYVRCLEIIVHRFQQPLLLPSHQIPFADLPTSSLSSHDSPLLSSSSSPSQSSPIPISSSPLGIISRADVKRMFSNVDTLLALHHDLLKALQMACSPSYFDAQIGQIFLEFGPKCLPYAQYGQDYDQCIVTLRRLEKENLFLSSFLNANSTKQFTNGVMYLESLLINPIQRIPRLYSCLGSLCDHECLFFSLTCSYSSFTTDNCLLDMVSY